MTNWKKEIRIKQFLDQEKPFEEVRDRICAVLKRQPEYDVDDRLYDEDFNMLVDETAEVDSVWYLDLCLSALYDWADENKIWIGGDGLASRLPSVGDDQS